MAEFWARGDFVQLHFPAKKQSHVALVVDYCINRSAGITVFINHKNVIFL